eukprot:13616313-Heterocapsa_arctica.AAC.1
MASMKMQELHTCWTMTMSSLVGDNWGDFSGMVFYEVTIEPELYQEPVKPANRPRWESIASGESDTPSADA